MNDIGFGMIDRRSVAAILFAFGLSIALGFNVPIDTSNVLSLFGSVVLFTGFLFLCRSVIRMILIVFSMVVIKPDDLRWSATFNPDWIDGIPRPLLIRVWYVFDYPMSLAKHPNFLRFIRLLDRLTLVGIVLLSVLPFSQRYFNLVGIWGVAIMLLIYVLRGSYTLLMRDSVDAENENNLHSNSDSDSDIKVDSWNR